MDAGSVMSTLIPTASGLPRDRRAATVSSRASRPRAMTATRAPSVGEDLGHGPSHPLAPAGHDRRRVSESQIHAGPPPSLRRAACRCPGVIGRTACSRRAVAPPWWPAVPPASPGGCPPAPPAPTSENLISRVVGTGAVSVRTQRRMMGPALCPAVSSQLATPGIFVGDDRAEDAVLVDRSPGAR